MNGRREDDEFHGPGSLFHDPAYRHMVDEVGDQRLAFAEYLVERGDLDAAETELERARADLEATPDGWEIVQIEALRERMGLGLTVRVEEVRAILSEAEERRAEWLGLHAGSARTDEGKGAGGAT